ncbi:MAG: lactate utilization protein B [Bacteroidota bacterium]|nr:lactate utilization protein B [Bacteroidota bacterium]
MYEIFNKENQCFDMNSVDRDYREKSVSYMSQYKSEIEKGKLQYAELELAKERAAAIKFKVLNELDKYLIEFETNFVSRGGKVIWARDAEEAIREILNIAERKQAKLIVKSKNNITEEINLNEQLIKAGLSVQETTAGEFIYQESKEASDHFVNPLIGKSREEITSFFNQKFGLPLDASSSDLTLYIRNYLRDKFSKADIGITGANFLVSNVGGVALTENEGNALMTVSMPRTHIVIAGIEKVIPSLKDLDLFWPLLATHGTGQKITAYNSVVLGPRQEGEIDGPDDMYVILLDNGRTKLLEKVEQRRALSCIHCGACLNVCPVYKTIGGLAYQSTYSGPIGSVVTPHLKGLDGYNSMSYASSLCGSCTEICPVKINLHELLLFNRNDAVVNHHSGYRERFLMLGWKTIMGNRKYLDFLSPKNKNWLVKKIFNKKWGQLRELPIIKEKSFKQLWEERENPPK